MGKVVLWSLIWGVVSCQYHSDVGVVWEKSRWVIRVNNPESSLLLRDAAQRKLKIYLPGTFRLIKGAVEEARRISSALNLDVFPRRGKLEIKENEVVLKIFKGKSSTGSFPGHIRVASLHDPPTNVMLQQSNTTRLSGLSFDVLKLLAGSIGVSFAVISAPDNSYGSISQGKWTGMVRMVKDNEADVAVAPFSITWSRAQVIDYTGLYFEEKDSLLIPASRLGVNFLSCASPFQYQVWMSVMGSIAVVGLSMWLISKANSPNRTRKAADHVLDAFTLLCCQAGQVVSNSLATRLVASAWFLGAVILVYTYTSTLISYVTVPVVSPVLESLEDLAYKAPVRLALWKGTFYDLIIMNATSGPFKALKDSFQVSDYSTDFESAVKKIISGKYAYIGDRSSLEHFLGEDYYKNRQCRMTLAKTDVAKGPRAFIVQKNSPLLPLIDQKLMQIHEGGLSNYWASHGMQFQSPCLKKEGIQGVQRALDLRDFMSAFCLLGLGFVFGMLAACGEIMWDKK